MDIGPRPQQIAQALRIATRAIDAADQPSMRLHAWAVLKSARGQSVRYDRLRRMQGNPPRNRAPAAISGTPEPQGAA
ncbi:hypothetical protein SAMN05444722_1714 [Rhodovulum sp. ES.010]|uniref:hypothetical protein n=1 Tax=Rhodovulum sp. ES.010 TaxID=1882821 RepID=UPI000929EFCF|nr:hypothetical protein [Rhodovulum sp. ES.010]SIO36938.1 hypothetical protein SAMN05444722_1714 [Rhodovulum sp. ES.010]